MDYLNIKASYDTNKNEADTEVEIGGTLVTIAAMFGTAAYGVARNVSEETGYPVELVFNVLKASLALELLRKSENTEECERTNVEVTNKEEATQ